MQWAHRMQNSSMRLVGTTEHWAAQLCNPLHGTQCQNLCWNLPKHHKFENAWRHTYNVVIRVFESLNDLWITDFILHRSRENGRKHVCAKTITANTKLLRTKHGNKPFTNALQTQNKQWQPLISGATSRIKINRTFQLRKLRQKHGTSSSNKQGSSWPTFLSRQWQQEADSLSNVNS